MKYVSIVLLGVLLFSCKSEIDRKNINSIKLFTIKYIESKDYKSILDLTDHNRKNDKLSALRKANISSRLSCLKASIFNAKDVLLIQYKQQSGNDDLYLAFEEDKINVFIKADGQYYNIRGTISKNEDDEYFYSYLNCINLTENCLIHEHQRYLPTNIKFGSVYWTLNYDNKSFKEFGIKGKNATGNDIENITFRLVLKKKDGSEFFSKTINRAEKVYSGDTFDFRISELDDFYAGFILDSESFSFSSELLEVLPRPNNESCELLHELNRQNH